MTTRTVEETDEDHKWRVLDKGGANLLLGATITDVYLDDRIYDGGFTIEFMKGEREGVFVLSGNDWSMWVERIELSPIPSPFVLIFKDDNENRTD